MLTDAKVRTAKSRPKAYKIADANRLFLMVTPSGGKLWRWNYEDDGKNKTMAFGAYPIVSLADARENRDEAWSMLCEGHDPSVAKRLKIEANLEAERQTFERVAREWYENAKSQWATIHAGDVIRNLERDVFPTIGSLPIAQLTPPLIIGVLREIETRGAIETANASQWCSSTPSPRGSRRATLPKSWARCSSRCEKAGSRRSRTSCHCAR
jgi:hypothetical protein